MCVFVRQIVYLFIFRPKHPAPSSRPPPSPLSDSCHTHVICALKGVCTRAGAKTYYFICLQAPTIKIIYALYSYMEIWAFVPCRTQVPR